jgi:RNA-binding protein FUS
MLVLNDHPARRKTCKKCNKPKSKRLKDLENKQAMGWLNEGLTEDASNRIFIKGFDPKVTTEEDLRELFSGRGLHSSTPQLNLSRF